MGGRLSASWQLFKVSWGVLRSDTELVIYPIVSAVATLIVTASFFIPLSASGAFAQIAAARQGGAASIVWAPYLIVGFLFYLVQYFIIFFANSALVGAALIRLQGGNPTVGDGFRIAARHTGTILGYAAISATVGMILRAIADRGGTWGRIVAGLLGAGWNIATYLVVPVLVVENIGPIAAIRRSADLLKRTWGEQIVGNIGFGALFGLLSVAVIVVFGALAFALAQTGAIALVVAVAVIGVLALVALGIVNSALGGIYRAAIYRYAATGETTSGFDPALVRGAFRQKTASAYLP